MSGGTGGPGSTIGSPGIGGLELNDPGQDASAGSQAGGGGGAVGALGGLGDGVGLGGNGGAGGASGLIIPSSIISATIGSLNGSNGGDGEPSNTSPASAGKSGGGGGGGEGGHGLIVPGSVIDLITISGITAGDGGNGGAGTYGGGDGGDGGVGIFYLASGAGGGNPTPRTYENSGVVTGGNGGNGGNGIIRGGNGGNGGDGVFIAASGVAFTNSGSVTGGDGGNGVFGGHGGDGVAFAARGATFINSGTVTAGDGGVGDFGVSGVGVRGGDLTIINSGTITGGLSADGVTPGRAIEFTFGVNNLTLEAGYQINGTVRTLGLGSFEFKLVLGGDANSSFDVSNIGPQYRGFHLFEKTGLSTWTLENSTPFVTQWAINGGTLRVSSEGALGDPDGGVVSPPDSESGRFVPSIVSFDGGTLQFLSGFSIGHEIVLNGAGTFDTNGHDVTLLGLISGVGDLIKVGLGTLTLSQVNTYSGGTSLNGGTLDLAALSAAGTGAITFGDGTEVLKIENAALTAVSSNQNTFGNLILDIGVGDVIDLAGLTFAKNAKISYNPKTDILTVTSGGVTDTLTLVAPQGAQFALSSDGSNGTDITLIGVAHEGHGHGHGLI